MLITLTYLDIEAALKNYIQAMGISREVTAISISTLRKGDEPFRAEVTLADLNPNDRASVLVRAASPEVTGAFIEPVIEDSEEEEAEDMEALAPEVLSTSEMPKNLFGG